MKNARSVTRLVVVVAVATCGAVALLAASAKGRMPQAEAATTQGNDKAMATLSGGCFWGVQELIRKLPGVLQTTVGYTGGSTDSPGYEQVHTGSTGHAEAVQIVYDPKVISYESILRYFFRLHDPTTPNRQGNDTGNSIPLGDLLPQR